MSFAGSAEAGGSDKPNASVRVLTLREPGPAVNIVSHGQ